MSIVSSNETNIYRQTLDDIYTPRQLRSTKSQPTLCWSYCRSKLSVSHIQSQQWLLFGLAQHMFHQLSLFSNFQIKFINQSIKSFINRIPFPSLSLIWFLFQLYERPVQGEALLCLVWWEVLEVRTYTSIYSYHWEGKNNTQRCTTTKSKSLVFNPTFSEQEVRPS